MIVFYLLYMLTLSGQPIHGYLMFETYRDCDDAKTKWMLDMTQASALTGLPAVAPDAHAWCFKSEMAK